MELIGVIVDDEAKSRENLRMMLTDFCKDIKVVASFSNTTEAADYLMANKVDVLFLDVQLQRETGFDLLDRLQDINFEIIFTTAYAEYAIRAFKHSAIDYLLKPIDIEELQKAVEKVRLKKQKLSKSDFKNQMKNLLDNYKSSDQQSYKIALPTANGLIFVRLLDIIYCEASSNYTVIYFKGGAKHIVSKTLKEYEDILTESGFYRIHNSFLINLNEIKQYIKGDGGQVVLNNGVTLDVAKRKKEGFLKLVNPTV